MDRKTNETEMDQKRLQRRNLLKAGAIAAPVVMTFRASSAWAVSAGCLVQEGGRPLDTNVLPTPRSLSQPLIQATSADGRVFTPVERTDIPPDVDKNTLPPEQRYQMIIVTQTPGTAVTSSSNSQELAALVYNGNIGTSCYASIYNLLP